MLGGAFEGVEDTVSPFGYKRGEGIDAGSGEPVWIVSKERYKYDPVFDTLNPVDGKVTGAGKIFLLPVLKLHCAETLFVNEYQRLFPELRNLWKYLE
jgi:hypothetical protein